MADNPAAAESPKKEKEEEEEEEESVNAQHSPAPALKQPSLDPLFVAAGVVWVWLWVGPWVDGRVCVHVWVGDCV